MVTCLCAPMHALLCGVGKEMPSDLSYHMVRLSSSVSFVFFFC